MADLQRWAKKDDASFTMIFVRFGFGFAAVAVTCFAAMERDVWREQLVVLLSLSVLAGLVCAAFPACARAIKDHWIF